MKATLRLSDLPPADADRTRDLVQRVLAEAPHSGAQGTATYDACNYELTVSEAGAAERRIVARDGSLTPAQQELIGLLRRRLTPVRP